MDFGDEEEEEEEEVQEETVAVVAAAMTVGQMTRVEEGQENEVSYGRKDKTNSSEFPKKFFNKKYLLFVGKRGQVCNIGTTYCFLPCSQLTPAEKPFFSSLPPSSFHSDKCDSPSVRNS